MLFRSGNAIAQANLGLMYMQGRGVLQNDAESVKWYRKAAEQGYARGQYNLGWLYYKGRGGLGNALKAHMWGSLAVLNGEPRGGELRDTIAKQMTPSQISQAQAMAQQCQTRQFKGC